MMTPAQAAKYIDEADFSNLPDYQSVFGVLGAPTFQPDAGQDQSLVVGSAINSFTKGVSVERRNAINDSSLFAQLMANSKVPDSKNVADWYNVYFDALTAAGWVLQSRNFAKYDANSYDVDVNQAILSIASGLLGGTGAIGYLLIKSTLDSLQKLSDNSPWITTFARESQHERVGRFQVSLASGNPEDDFLVNLMAFELEATEELNQILWFKFKSTSATLKQFSGAITINDSQLSHVKDKIAAKIDEFTDAFFSQAIALPKKPA